MPEDAAKTIHIVSLGCAKNRVDSEVLLGLLQGAGYRVVDVPEEAEVVLINTCGFIEEARAESVDAVLEAAELKRTGRCQTLVVAGCLVQRYGADLAAELPEADKLIGTADLAEVVALLRGADRLLASPGPSFLYDHTYARRPSLGPHTAYVKVAEGCDRTCAFCAVPAIRGPQRSRAVTSVLAEVRQLVDQGVREVCLVAQDLTAYGRDLAPRPGLAGLVAALRQVPDLAWIRLLYAYPSEVDDALLAVLAEGLPVVPYLDVPVQHVDDAVLRAMRRGYGGDAVRRLVDRLRAAVDGIFLRTTLLVGHPGEDDAAFAALEAFCRDAALDHVGVFAYSPEEGTPAFGHPAPPAAEAAARRDRLLAVQRDLSAARLARQVGTTLHVLVDGPSPEIELLGAGRHAGQAPEVDGLVHLADLEDVTPGRFVRAVVEQSADYDLVARVISPA
jgi:ribosomal protein S12 methylthiotransferase